MFVTITVNSGFKVGIYNQRFQNFQKNIFETAEFFSIVVLTAILRLLQRNKPIFL